MSKLLKLIKFLWRMVPSRLPTGLSAFNSWVEAIVEHSGLPDNASTRRVASIFILEAPPNVGYISVHKVSGMLVKAAANQVASQVLKDTREEAKQPSVL